MEKKRFSGKSRFAALLVSLATAVSVLHASSAAAAAELVDKKNPPDVIIFLIDAMRPDHISGNGYSRNTTPEIDKFIKESILFRNVYAQSSWTKPSVGTLFTGWYPSTHGAVNRELTLYSGVTMAEMFKSIGYVTAAFSTNPNVTGNYGFDRGFDYFEDVYMAPDYAPADVVHERLMKYMDRRPPKPLFLYVHLMDPHFPFQPPPAFDLFSSPEAFKDTKRRAWTPTEEMNKYDGEIAFADYYFGKFVERLKKDKKYDGSLIIVMSDHGEGSFERTGGRHGNTLFNDNLRSTLIMRLPGAKRAGVREDRIVRLIDIYPTLCDLLGVTPLQFFQGGSAAQIIAGEPTPRWSPVLFAELDYAKISLRSWISGDFKLIEGGNPKKISMLFDLKKDPGELTNIIGSEASRAAIMRAAMDGFAAGLKRGYYLEFVNGKQLESKHRITGWIKIKNGVIDGPVIVDGAEGAQIDVDAARRMISFSCDLANHEYARTASPGLEVVRDTRRIRFDVSGAKASFTISVDEDSRKVAQNRLLLGDGKRINSKKTLPVAIGSGDERLNVPASQFKEELPRVDEVLYRFYFIPGPANTKVKLNEEQKRRLQDLGYIH